MKLKKRNRYMTRSNGTGRPKCYKDELIVLVVEESLRWEGYGL